MGLFSGEDHFSFPLEDCMALSGTMKATSPGGGGFQVNSSSGLPSLESAVHDILSNKDLTSHLWGQPRAIAHNILRLSWTSLTNNSKQGFMLGIF